MNVDVTKVHINGAQMANECSYMILLHPKLRTKLMPCDIHPQKITLSHRFLIIQRKNVQNKDVMAQSRRKYLLSGNNAGVLPLTLEKQYRLAAMLIRNENNAEELVINDERANDARGARTANTTRIESNRTEPNSNTPWAKAEITSGVSCVITFSFAAGVFGRDVLSWLAVAGVTLAGDGTA